MENGLLEQAICEAAEIIVERAISTAGYDRTIQATIIEQVDATIGKYKVKYQDSTFYAYSQAIDAKYSKGTNVYVLIQGNDLEKGKIIIDSVEKLGTDYVSIIENKDAYDKIGGNIVATEDTFELCSYYLDRTITLYDVEKTSNLLTLINKEEIDHYIRQGSSILIGATFRNSLKKEQQYQGSFGLRFILEFNADGDIIEREYQLDENDMKGNPYLLTSKTEQSIVFNIEKDNFIRIKRIEIFNKNFPQGTKSPSNTTSDIFISNIFLYAANRFSEEDLNGCLVSINAPKGTIFRKEDAKEYELPLKAVVRVKGKIIDEQSQNLFYYWFREDASVVRSSKTFHEYGGLGWRCLNEVSVKTETANGETVETKEFSKMTSTYIVKKEDILSNDAKYKCVVHYGENIFSREITLANFGCEYDLILTSSLGEVFYENNGKTVLTCSVLQNGVEVSDFTNYSFSWAEVNKQGQFFTRAAAAIPNQLPLNINTITDFSIFKCSVFIVEHLESGEQTTFIGSKSLTISNILQDPNKSKYSLTINHGTQMFKYTAGGTSPASGSLEQPMVIPTLTFSLYDINGNEVNHDLIDITKHVTWKVPNKDTMLSIQYGGDNVEVKDDYNLYHTEDLTYKIANSFNYSDIDNTIYLTVNYGNEVISAHTDFTFVKDGDNGTNGTDYVCKIIPSYLQATRDENGSYTWSPVGAPNNLECELWKSGVQIWTGKGSTSEEGISIDSTWNILKNKYGTIQDISSFEFDGNNVLTAKFTEIKKELNKDVNNILLEGDPVNIVRCQINYNNVAATGTATYYFGTLPIISAEILNSDYSAIKLKENTGFLYVVYDSNGKNPNYNRSDPFEIELFNSNNELDSSENLKYNWYIRGTIYQGKWIEANYLKIREDKDLAPNKKNIYPIDICNGECLSAAVVCEVTKDGVAVARIHIPVHFMLNRFGLANLNDWDGNSVEIKEKGGYILAPQVGAGVKDNNNSFTGVLMGEVKEGGKSSADIGLLGYHQGERTIFLDAKTGKAEFGKADAARIILDPTSNKAQLYSGNYSTSEKTGMLIDLTTPEIKFGSENFSVTPEGHLTAKGGGSIGGWQILDTELYNGNTGMASSKNILNIKIPNSVNEKGYEEEEKSIAFWAGSENFMVAHDGYLKATQASIGNGNFPIFISGYNENSYIFSGLKSSFTSYDQQGFYLGTNGLALGSFSEITQDGTTISANAFEVTPTGVMTARVGYLGGSELGWEIRDNYLKSIGGKNSVLDPGNGGVYLSSSTKIGSGDHPGINIGSSVVTIDSKSITYSNLFVLDSAEMLSITPNNFGLICGWWASHQGFRSNRDRYKISFCQSPNVASSPNGDGVFLTVGDYKVLECDSLINPSLKSYQRITAGPGSPFDEEDQYFKLLDDGSLYADYAQISTNGTKYSGTTGVYLGVEGFRVGNRFKLDENGENFRYVNDVTIKTVEENNSSLEVLTIQSKNKSGTENSETVRYKVSRNSTGQINQLTRQKKENEQWTDTSQTMTISIS